jgi:hypothetical protein
VSPKKAATVASKKTPSPSKKKAAPKSARRSESDDNLILELKKDNGSYRCQAITKADVQCQNVGHGEGRKKKYCSTHAN